MIKKKTNSINIFQLKSEISFDTLDFYSDGYTLEFQDSKYKLFLKNIKGKKPQWVNYIKKYLSTDTDKIFNKTASFIFIVRHISNSYAITGGRGHVQLKKYIVDEFGCNVALRMINENAISSLNQRAMKGTTRQIIRAVTGYDPLFDRDNYNRILKTIEGKAEFEGRKFKISGKSSLVLRTERDISKISEIIDEIETILSQDEKIHFPRCYSVVNNKSLLEKLDLLLFQEFKPFWENKGNREKLYLEFDDPLLQFKCAKFTVTFRRKKINVHEFDLELIRDRFHEKEVGIFESLDELSKIRVTGTNEDGFDEVSKEPFSNMLICEITENNTHYIKIGKKWYQILDELQKFLDSEIKKIKVDSDLLPLWEKNKFPKENDYNMYVSELRGWACLDEDCVQMEGKSKIELCDIFDKSKDHFYHIKRTWGCKSAYLFTQGITAVESYCQSKSFRDKCVEKWPQLFKKNGVKSGTIIFGIAAEKASDSNFPQNMTYFAKLNLYSAIVRLKQHDYKVVLSPIKFVD